MRICHFTPHLPPDQAANALLPFHLGCWARDAGDEVAYVAHPPRAGRSTDAPGPVEWVPARASRLRLSVIRQMASLVELVRIVRRALPLVKRADVVHVHSNGLIAEAGGVAAWLERKPLVLTLYGTEIWHYRRRAFDLFTRMYRRAARVTFYSRGLLDRAREIGLDRPGLEVVYPPVADTFTWHDAEAQRRARASLGLSARRVLVNVKRLHPLAGQRDLVEAMPAVLAAHPDTLLLVCGTGPLSDELRALATRLGIAEQVIFTGLVDNRVVAGYVAAADAFVLPSLLEAGPTVALEALASGTPVVSSDNPGGVELHGLFGDDVRVVPKQDPAALARAIVETLAGGRRASAPTREIIERDFRRPAVAGRFRRVYLGALGERPAPP
jgi:phosphatidylinositol alpha-1,6-mannosyltransferase